MPRWFPKVLLAIHDLAAIGSIHVTAKAEREVDSIGLELDEDDVRDVLLGLTTMDFWGRQASRESNEWLYIFKPDVGGVRTYVKLVLRAQCVVVSFHEDGGENDEEIC